MNNNKQGGIQAGLNAHLSKPVQPDMLFETLENLIEIDSGLAILPLGLKTAWNTILSESEGSHTLGFPSPPQRMRFFACAQDDKGFFSLHSPETTIEAKWSL